MLTYITEGLKFQEDDFFLLLSWGMQQRMHLDKAAISYTSLDIFA